MLQKALLDILACPSCHSELHPQPDFEQLTCESCQVFYPIKAGIPHLTQDAAQSLPLNNPLEHSL